MENLIFLTCFIVFSLLTALSMLIAGYVFSYNAHDRVKSSTYECGLSPKSSAKIRFNIIFFNYLIIFLIFDTSTIFLYPLFATGVEYSQIHYWKIVLFLMMILFAICCSVKLKFLRSR